jgi:hypothetical protein
MSEWSGKGYQDNVAGLGKSRQWGQSASKNSSKVQGYLVG